MVANSHTVIAESTLVGVLRLGLFLFCRKYLLRTLSHDLQDLSSEAVTESGSTHAIEDEVELGSLPAPVGVKSPASTSTSTEVARRRQLLWARSAFALCFTECCTLFVLLMCQSADVLDPKTRMLNWQLSLVILLGLSIVGIPLLFAWALTYRKESGAWKSTGKRSLLSRLLFTIVPVFTTLFLLSYIPIPTGLVARGYFTVLIARLAVAGTFLLGTLSGLGAADNAWAFLPLSRAEKPAPSSTDIEVAERSLARIREDLMARQAEIQKREAAKSPQAESSWLSRVVPSFRGDASQTAALQEIAGLEALEDQMLRNIETMRHQRSDAMFRSTFAGSVTTWAMRAFALYCVFRFFNSIYNLIAPVQSKTTGSNSPDLIAAALASILSLVPSTRLEPSEVAAAARQLSLLMVGAIILSSVRMLLRGIGRLLRVMGRNQGAALMLLLLAQLMFIYLLSTLIQMRTSFPPPSGADTSASDANLFETLPEFQVFGSLFDATYVLSACLGGLVRWVDEHVNT